MTSPGAILICAQPRSGSNMLCDLISQVGYDNLGEYTRTRMGGAKGEIKTLDSVLNRDKIVIKLHERALMSSLNTFATAYGSFRVVCLYRDNIIEQAVSSEICQQTRVYMYSDKRESDFVKDSFPQDFLADTKELIEKDIEARASLLKSEEYLTDAARRIIRKIGEIAVGNCSRYFKLSGVLDDTLMTVVKYHEILENPRLQVKKITGIDSADIKITTFKQSNELNTMLANIVTESLTPDEQDWYTGGWTNSPLSSARSIGAAIHRVPGSAFTIRHNTNNRGV